MYKVELENKGDMQFSVKSRDYVFNIDLKGRGMTPPDVFLASLGSCLDVYLRKYLENSGLAMNEFKITLEADLSKENPVCFRQINVKIDTRDVHLDEKRKSAILEFIKNCPIHNTLKTHPEVHIEIF
jgi:uncharacterized OsmC-like protein